MPAAPSLVPLGRGQLATVRHLLPPERPGPMIAQHLLGTGNGSCLADRWPAPRALLVETGGNWTLAGDPGALDPAAVAGRVAGFVEAPAAFEPLLRAAARELHEWPRVIFTLEAESGFNDPPVIILVTLVASDAWEEAGDWRFVDASPLAILVFDSDGAIRTANPAGDRLLVAA